MYESFRKDPSEALKAAFDRAAEIAASLRHGDSHSDRELFPEFTDTDDLFDLHLALWEALRKRNDRFKCSYLPKEWTLPLPSYGEKKWTVCKDARGRSRSETGGIAVLEFDIGYCCYGDDRWKVSVLFRQDRTASVLSEPPDEEPVITEISQSDAERLLSVIDGIGLEGWKDSYWNRNVLDGMRWGLTITYANAYVAFYDGHNAGPEQLPALMRALEPYGIDADYWIEYMGY